MHHPSRGAPILCWTLIGVLVWVGTQSACSQKRTPPQEAVQALRDSDALAACHDSMANGYRSDCHYQLPGALLILTHDSLTGNVHFVRFGYATGYEAANRYDSTLAALETQFGPSKTCAVKHRAWALGKSTLRLMLRGPDAMPVDSSEGLWAVVVFGGPDSIGACGP